MSVTAAQLLMISCSCQACHAACSSHDRRCSGVQTEATSLVHTDAICAAARPSAVVLMQASTCQEQLSVSTSAMPGSSSCCSSACAWAAWPRRPPSCPGSGSCSVRACWPLSSAGGAALQKDAVSEIYSHICGAKTIPPPPPPPPKQNPSPLHAPPLSRTPSESAGGADVQLTQSGASEVCLGTGTLLRSCNGLRSLLIERVHAC